MDKNVIRSYCLLVFLVLHDGQLTKAESLGCQDACSSNEYCFEDYDNYEYLRERENEENYQGGNRQNYEDVRRQEIPQHGYLNEREYDSSEPTLEDRTLIKSLPLKDNGNDYRSELDRRNGYGHGHRLPPEETANWDKINTRDFNARKFRNGGYKQEQSKNDYQSLAKEEHTIHRDFSQNDDSDERGDTKIWETHALDDGDSRKHLPPVPLESDEERHQNDEEAEDSPNGKVLINGVVKGAEDSVKQSPNTEKKYDAVKAFFKTQQASSIVEVPNAVKREEAAKSFDAKFVVVKKEDVDEVSKDEELPGSKRNYLKISLNRNVNRETVKARLAPNDYTSESEKDVAKRMNEDGPVKEAVAREMNTHILAAESDKGDNGNKPKTKLVTSVQPKYFVITIVVVGCVTGVILAAVAVYLIMKRYNETKKFKPVSLPGQEAATDYQELCRQLRANQGWDGAPVKTGTSMEKEKGLLGSTKPPKYTWSEEPVVPNMDISTGHVVLAYMEDHLNNKNRLNKEWEALCTYEAEPNRADIGKNDKNVRKNRYSDVLPYDHNRVTLRETANATGSDYVNASFITDHDPRNPAYIATQGPLAHTVSDFWQMVWEQGVVVVVNLTRLSDLGLPQCHRYWPEDGHETYHIYEVHLVSEHIWCDDYLVRSFYLKNLQTSETRTVTQFHFLSWPDLNVPTSPKPLLEFRRKVNKCFRGRSCPIVVHCSGGVGRTGCYILIDMVLNKMMRGAKEIDIAATVEHLRDQRPHMVKTKAQFEFALTAVAEEVSAILQALAK